MRRGESNQVRMNTSDEDESFAASRLKPFRRALEWKRGHSELTNRHDNANWIRIQDGTKTLEGS